MTRIGLILVVALQFIAHLAVFAQPVELPKLPDQPARGAQWTANARIVQPWGEGQHRLIVEAQTMAPRLAQVYGINAIALQPPLAFNRIGDDLAISDEQFRRALDIYRAHGYRIILYTSIIHVGHGPVWQSGVLHRTYPHWTQRDANGYEIDSYGAKWLNPIGEALEYAIAYTRDMVDAYRPDAIMLDNNQFLYANTGPNGSGGMTGYGPACRDHFREWAGRTLGDQLLNVFGTSPEGLELPTSPGPLMNLFMTWRCAVWAEAVQRVRSALPDDVAVLANTQYLYKKAVLATDMQYRHLDVVFSETNNRPSWAVSAKMILGHALAGDRPVWSYMGTVKKEGSYDELWPPETITRIVGATLATNTNPWLLYYGFHSKDELNAASREEIARLLRFRADYPALYEGCELATNIGAVFTTRNRRYFDEYPIPKSFYKLQELGYPLAGVLDEDLNQLSALEGIEYLVAESIRCLSAAEAKGLTNWVKQGGTLLTTPDAGTFDMIGLPRDNNVLADALGVPSLRSMPVGRGRLIVDEAKNLPHQVSQINDANRFTYSAQITGEHGFIEVRPYSTPDHAMVLHIVNHGDPILKDYELLLPKRWHNQSFAAVMYEPSAEAPPVALRRRGTALQMPAHKAYVIVRMEPKP